MPRTVADGYRRLRASHHVNVLQWLRNSMLLCTLAAALLYLWVATQASHDIAAANRTEQAVADIDLARSAAGSANDALRTAFANEDVTLIGTGSTYIDDVTQVSKYLTLAAEGNAAGAEGTSKIQFAQDQLDTYLQLGENAVRDYTMSISLGTAGETYALDDKDDLFAALDDLRSTEQAALDAQRNAWAIDPWVFWWALLGPVIALLLLAMTTAHVLARHFRRHVSRWLWGSLLTNAATAATVGIFNRNDGRHLSTGPWASYPATLIVAPFLFLLAAVFGYVAYRPRLAEYRFSPS